MSRYLEMLSLFGVAGAHPGGLAFSKAVLQKAAPSPNQPILDAGCGTGQTAAYLGHLLYPVTVVDRDPIMLEKAKKDLRMKGLPSLHIRRSWNISRFLLSPFPVSCQNRSSVFHA